ncbi:Transcription factor [Niveomyces insectorum RCEF 264]|uniref:Transcription factor n=1 Tax=Niveomyces insectorum RCEF 264 TaxID=1081102 RepID=A0A167Y3B6_9HYPO|nr:Transcription factor [Niveomyces insectorum RCEF 264]
MPPIRGSSVKRKIFSSKPEEYAPFVSQYQPDWLCYVQASKGVSGSSVAIARDANVAADKIPEGIVGQATSSPTGAPTPHPTAPVAPVPPPLPVGLGVGAGLPDEAGQRRLIKAYFAGPHYFCFYTFIHPPTLMQMFDNGLVPNFLLLIIIATALRFLEPHNRLADAWADECRRLVMLELFSPPSTATLQALLLLQRFEWHRASHVAAWFLSGLAVRLAHGLQLNLEIADEACVPVTVREVRRRLVWSCFVMESLIENGRRPLASLDIGAVEVKLPCNEQAFQLGLETDMPALDGQDRHQQPPPSTADETADRPSPIRTRSTRQPLPCATVESRLGVSSFLVKLAVMRRAILDYTMPYHPRNKSHVPPEPAPWASESPFFAYEAKLHRWGEGLPQEMQFNDDVLYRRQSSQLVSFVTLHCLYHGCYCDLYRIGSYVSSLYCLSRQGDSGGGAGDALRPEADFLAYCRRGRVQHAFSICRVIYDSIKHHPAGHDPVVGISASLAIRVLVLERQQDEDASLGLTDDILSAHLDAAVQCAKEIALRSVPIRDLSALASRKDILAPAASTATDEESDLFHNYNAADTSREQRNEEERQQQQQQEQNQHHEQRHQAASLTDAGAFPGISPLAPVLGVENHGSDVANDVRADAASSSTTAADDDSSVWRLGAPWAPPPPVYGHPAYETYSPNELGVASAWGDGTLNFSMTPTQFDWINQSLGFDFNNGGGGVPPYGGSQGL